MALRRTGAGGHEPLCAACLRFAARAGSGTAERLFLALADLQDDPAAPQTDGTAPQVCPECGTGPSEMLDAAMAGCPDCYRWFAHVLLPKLGAAGGPGPA